MKVFAAIYIGSYEISLKIFELSAKRGIREIDYIRHRMELGKDIYTCGSVGYERTEELCNTLEEYSAVMKSYKTDDYQACVGPMFKDAKNGLFVLEQIYLRTGLDVQVLSNSEYRFISYKSVASKEGFDEMTKEGAAVVDIGGSSLQITLFIQGKAVTTQHLLLGTMRIREKLSDIGMLVSEYEKQIRELVDKELNVFRALYLKDTQIPYVILMGDYIVDIAQNVEKNAVKHQFPAERLINYTKKLRGRNLEEIAEELSLANERDPLIRPALIMYGRVAEELNAKTVYVPGMSVNDGIAYDYAQKHNIVKSMHDFDKDVLSAAEHLSMRFFAYQPHIQALENMALMIFDTMRKIHGLGRRERLLLQVAAILHDCGKYISLVNAPQCSYDIIMSSEIIGLTHLEREIAASTVLYNTFPLDAYEKVADKMDQSSYMVVAKLAAILKVANALDRSHKQKLKNVKAAVVDKKLVITIETEDDLGLEKKLFETKSALFEEVYSMKPVIKMKKVYR